MLALPLFLHAIHDELYFQTWFHFNLWHNPYFLHRPGGPWNFSQRTLIDLFMSFEIIVHGTEWWKYVIFLMLHFKFLGPWVAHRVKMQVDQGLLASLQIMFNLLKSSNYKFEPSKNNVLSLLRPMDENPGRHEQVSWWK